MGSFIANEFGTYKHGIDKRSGKFDRTMEDHFENLLYLAVGVVYLVLKNWAGRQPIADKHVKSSPTPATNTNEFNTRKGAPPKALGVKKPLPQHKMERVVPYHRHIPFAKEITKQPTDKKIDRILRRYNGWKKAIVMREFIKPYY